VRIVNIETAIKMIHGLPQPNGWVRLEHVRKTSARLDLGFTIHDVEWSVVCRGVHETHITDFDGGGIFVYSARHPAGRQYTSRRAELRRFGNLDNAARLGALLQAHILTVDDWIPFDRYVSLVPGKSKSLQGPEFLMRAYAKAVRAQGEDPQLIFRGKSKSTKLRVLHFGGSFVVAAGFAASTPSFHRGKASS
jgi:hypothetical protein